jgi:hypothetical protein
MLVAMNVLGNILGVMRIWTHRTAVDILDAAQRSNAMWEFTEERIVGVTRRHEQAERGVHTDLHFEGDDTELERVIA